MVTLPSIEKKCTNFLIWYSDSELAQFLKTLAHKQDSCA